MSRTLLGIRVERWPEYKGDGHYTVEFSYNLIINQRDKNTSCDQIMDVLKDKIRNPVTCFTKKHTITHTCSKIQVEN